VKLKRIFLLLLLVAAGSLAFVSGCGKPVPTIPPGGLRVGDQALDFALRDTTGHVMKLKDMQEGWYLVLMLYRGHWCSACLNQLLDLKKDYAKFTALKIAVAGVSVDTVEEIAHFNEEWRLPFPLLSDPRFQIIDAYGARHEKGHEGKDISRPGIIILDPQKTVRFKHIGKNPQDRPTNTEILYMIEKLQKQPAK
jgi:thioredoxin-dependent peroxiredoxin